MRLVQLGSKVGVIVLGLALNPVVATMSAGVLIGGVMPQSAQAQAEDPVLFALSARHFEMSTAQLEQLAGGEEALVAKLLAVRTQEKPPFAGIRAEKILLEYAHREDVQAALEEDVQSTQYQGLARTIAVNIDSVTDSTARHRLARGVSERAQRDATFKTYAKSLASSKDEAVRKLAVSQD